MEPVGEARTPHVRPGNANAANAANRVGTNWRSLQGWPTLVGISFAAFVSLDMFRGEERGNELAPVVAASGLVYLAAAALQRPSTAWPVFFLSVMVITAAKLGVTSADPTWMLLGLAAVFVGYGLLRGATSPAGGLPLQTVAMIAFGAVAAGALYANAIIGAYLVSAGLFAHAAWDAYHHWTNRVVSRSMAEFCFVLDVLLAVAILIVSMRT